MSNKIIQIEQCDEGYLVLDTKAMEKYAVTKDGLVRKIKDLLGITDKTSHKPLIEHKDIIHDVLQDTIPETKHDMLRNVSPEPTEIATESLPQLKQEPTPELPTAHQKIKELAQMKDPNGILIPRFEYDPAQEKEIEGYANMFVVELPDGRAVIRYKGTHYYTTKEKILQLPYPVTVNYFMKNGIGISETAKTCLRAYRHYLANLLPDDKSLEIDWKDDSGSIAFREHEKKIKEQGDEQGMCDDITFDSCANNSPENCKYCVNESRYENKNKLAAQKPAPPLMRASVPP